MSDVPPRRTSNASFIEKQRTLPQARLESKLADAKPVYTSAEARAESERCLYCFDAPCITACPTEIDIPTFIKKIATGNVRGSATTIFEQNILGYSCARVCPVEVLCVGACVYNDWHRAPIQIGRLQRYATERAVADEKRTDRKLFKPKPDIGKRVALVGGGPASLACAAYLRLEGVRTTIFERTSMAGGLNTTGVAPYKLHAEESLLEVEWLAGLGVEFKLTSEIGRNIRASDLLRDYDAVFIGVGLGADSTLNIPGVDGPGVVGATAFIQRIKNEQGFTLAGVRRALIVGGGNTAIDVARELALLGIENVSLVYRRAANEMTGYIHEMEHARIEGVKLVDRARPVEVVRKDGVVTALKVAEVPDVSATSAGAEYEIAADLIVLAIGQAKLPKLAAHFPGVEVDARGCIQVEALTRRTGNPKVYAGGDCINGGKEVVNAVADGREAAREMVRGWLGA